MDELQVEKTGTTCLISFSGELTLEITPQLKKEVEEPLMKDGCRTLVMDLSQTNFLDSSGIGFLVALNNKIKQTGKKFYLFKPSSQVRKTLSLVKLIDYFTVLETREELDKVLQS